MQERRRRATPRYVLAFEHGGRALIRTSLILKRPAVSDSPMSSKGSHRRGIRICCRCVGPQGPTTQRLHALISQVMPVAPPAQSRGLCCAGMPGGLGFEVNRDFWLTLDCFSRLKPAAGSRPRGSAFNCPSRSTVNQIRAIASPKFGITRFR